MIQFRRFQSRLAFFFLGLMSLVQILVFVTMDVTNTRHARSEIERSLALGADNFRHLLELQTVQLLESVRILSADYAFKTALGTNDRATVESALVNQRNRVGADLMILASLDGEVFVDTRGAKPAYPPVIKQLVREAEQHNEASTVAIVDGKAYQLVVTPVLAPDPIGWLVAGFALDERFAGSMKQLLRVDVSFFEETESAPRLLASSLDASIRQHAARILAGPVAQDRVTAVNADDTEVLAFATNIGSVSPGHVRVLLQRSVSEELRPFQEARRFTLWLSLGGLLLSLLGALFVARSVTRPVRALVSAARRAESGDFSHTVTVKQKDELGELASAFNRMLKGLTERDRLQDLLGKFVSPAVAEKALSSGEVVLGGEKRHVTVLFSDLRNFTSFSESRDPQEVVGLLNTYLAAMSEVIDRNFGMVDKFLGDGVMAIFGAPVSGGDDAGNALQAALEMCAALDELNRTLAGKGLPELDMGIGVNTGLIVAGNMGGPSRLNYTVIGDAVNLAARIESLTKREGFETRIITTEETLRSTKREFAARSLGRVSIRGRKEPALLYALEEPGRTAARPQALAATGSDA